jgi:hypothetical protein
LNRLTGQFFFVSVVDSDKDLDPKDPYVFGPPGYGSFEQNIKKEKSLKNTYFLLASCQPLTKKKGSDPEPDP